MKKLLGLAAVALIVAPIFTSCDLPEECDHGPEVIITNENGDVITGDTINVKLGGINHTKFKVWYEEKDKGHLSYWRQYDNNEPEDLSDKRDPETNKIIFMHDDYIPVGGYWNGTSDVGWDESEVRTAFSTKFVNVGSIVKIWACVSDHTSGAVYYKVVE